MSILLTGGTGLVGSRLLRRFVDAGIDCHALVRKGKEAPAGGTRVEGDLLDENALKHAVQGVSAIVHFAAVFRTPMRMRSGGQTLTAPATSLPPQRGMHHRPVS